MQRLAALPALLRGIALAAVLGLGAPIAHAGDQSPCEILVVFASEAPGEIDPQLANERALRQPPFSGFHTMRVLDRVQRTVEIGTPLTVRLPNGRRLTVELLEALSNGRLRLRISIRREDDRSLLPGTTVVAAPGDPFFVAGQSFEGGTLVVGVRVGARPAARGASLPQVRPDWLATRPVTRL